ncbi:MAG TPA: alpha/beta hydrolase-fold protein [Elusimicrobiales bacterium]|nr:alpha/beta hydrolase-fold protein [Elusimicrobiales bacterium]
MQINYHKFYSHSLGQDFEFKSYGHAGKPVMVFPTSCGRFFDYEDHGMIGALSGYIERGDIVVFAVDGRDRESWYKPVRDEWIGIRHGQYEACITGEAIPFMRRHCNVSEKFMATGNSFGAFHSANFFLKHPDHFDSALCLSGVYRMQGEIGGYFDSGIYFNEPLSYLPGLSDEASLAKLREGYIVIAHGLGAWETFNDQAQALSEIIGSKDITCWYDRWGGQWPHDWQTWVAQVNKYLPQFREGVSFRGGTLKLTGPHRRINPLP